MPNDQSIANGPAPIRAILVMSAGDEGPGRRPSTGCCWSRLSHASWGQLMLGDDPVPLVLLLVFVLLLMPLFDGLWLGLVLALLIAFLARAWQWCHTAVAQEETDAPGLVDGARQENQTGENP